MGVTSSSLLGVAVTAGYFDDKGFVDEMRSELDGEVIHAHRRRRLVFREP